MLEEKVAAQNVLKVTLQLTLDLRDALNVLREPSRKVPGQLRVKPVQKEKKLIDYKLLVSNKGSKDEFVN